MFEGEAPGALARELVALYEKRAMLDAEIARVAAQVDERDDHHWAEPEAAPVRLSTWLATELRIPAGQARREVARARGLARLPETAAAFSGGLISAAHVDAITPLLELVHADAVPELESVLCDVAVTGSVRDVTCVLDQLRHAQDPADAARREHERTNTHALCLSTFGDGSLALTGTLTPAAGAVVLKAIEALAVPGEGESRTKQQRQADALVEMSRRVLEHGMAPAVRRVRPNVTVLVPLATLRDQPDAPGALIPGVGQVDGAVARAMVCDANVRRAVVAKPGFLHAPSELLDLGRSVRTATNAQFHALVARDRHCTYPGCDRPPDWCEAHHVDEWDVDVGPTDLDNLALVCTEHHHALHRKHLQLRRNPEGTYTIHRRDGAWTYGAAA